MSYRYTENDREKFEVPAEELAPWLIGKVLCHRAGDGFIIRGRIRETEAYRESDETADANRGAGGHTQLLSGGHLHYRSGPRGRLDIVAGTKGTVASVLIRAIDPYFSQSGKGQPANAVFAMDLDKVPGLDGLDLLVNETVWLEDDGIGVELGVPQPREGILGNEPLRFWAKCFTFTCK